MEKVRLIFLGDVSFSGQNAHVLSLADHELRQTLKQADAVICNFESTFTEEESPGLFQSPAAKASLLKDAGITHAVISNNHIYDYGYKGLEKTISVLRNAGIEPLGLTRSNDTDQQIASVKIRGVSIGLLCSGWTRVRQSPEDSNVFREYNQQEIAKSVKHLHGEFDHLVVVCHRGKMFVEYPSPSDKRAFQLYTRLGASAVIAHHPHVAQGISFRNDKLIAYSLGNFYFDSLEGHVQSRYSKDKQDLGLAIAVDVDRQKLLGYELIPVKRMNDSGVVMLGNAETSKVLSNLERLSGNTDKFIMSRVCFYSQYLRHVVPHFLRVLWHHKVKKQ